MASIIETQNPSSLANHHRNPSDQEPHTIDQDLHSANRSPSLQYQEPDVPGLRNHNKNAPNSDQNQPDWDKTYLLRKRPFGHHGHSNHGKPPHHRLPPTTDANEESESENETEESAEVSTEPIEESEIENPSSEASEESDSNLDSESESNETEESNAVSNEDSEADSSEGSDESEPSSESESQEDESETE